MDRPRSAPPLDNAAPLTPKIPPAHPSPQDDPQSLKILLRSAADKTLDWLSHATNEQLGACLVGLGASTYLVFGRVGLVLIGVVGGVVLHATWEGANGDGLGSEAHLKELTRRREVGVDVAKRILNWRDRRSTSAAEAGSNTQSAEGGEQEMVVDFSEFKPETADALKDFTDAVIRDYVQ